MLRSTTRPWRRSSAILLIILCGCAGGSARDGQGPENGQTGSPRVPVPPDYDTPGFRPPPNPGEPGGPVPSFPERPLWPNEQTARYGSTLYVAQRDRGFVVFDVVDPTSPSERATVDASGEPLWVHVSDDRLWVVVRGLDVEAQKVVDRALLFALDEPEDPREVARVDLDGRFVRGRAADAGVVLLSAVSAERSCAPEFGPKHDWTPTTEFELNAFFANGSQIETNDEVRVEGDGYVELPEGLAITLGQDFQTRSLRFVEIDATDGFTASDPMDFAESLVGTTPMQIRDGKLRLFEAAGAHLALTEVDLAAPRVRRTLTLPGSAAGLYDAVPIGSAFSGDLALVAVGPRGAPESTQGAHVVSFAGASPEVVFTFEQPVNWFFPLQASEGEEPGSWLGFVQLGDREFELVRFELSSDGTVAITGVLELPDDTLGVYSGPPLWVDESGQRAIIPHFGAPEDGFELGSVSLEGEMIWEPVDSPTLTAFSVPPGMSDDSYHWVEQPYERPARLVGLSNLAGGEAPRVTRTALGKDLSSLVTHSDHVAAIERRAEGTWLLHGKGELARGVPLSHTADVVRWVGDALLVGELGSQTECVEPEGPCDSARFSVVSIGADRVRGTVELPEVSPSPTSGVSTLVEWLEVAVGSEAAGLLQRRNFGCRSVSACEADGIPYALEEDGDLQGQIDEMWLYPLDLDNVALGDPVLLDRLDAWEFISADGFVQGHGFSLLAATDVVHLEDSSGIASARLSLLVSPEADDTAAPLRGWPVAVLDTGDDTSVVITLEPAETGDTLHQLALDGEATYLRSSLPLGAGYREHAWGSVQGYVLSQSADLCANDRSTRLSVVQSDTDGLSLTGEFEIAGHDWAFLAQSDRRVVLQQTVESVNRVAVIDVSGEPTLVTERVVGGAWYTPREGAVAGNRAFVATRTGGLVELTP